VGVRARCRSSTGAITGPEPDSTHANVAVEDPSVVHHNGEWHVFASTRTTGYEAAPHVSADPDQFHLLIPAAHPAA
jgi:hypothetical protein